MTSAGVVRRLLPTLQRWAGSSSCLDTLLGWALGRSVSIRTSPWSNGIPCWVDLRTADVRAASAFYSAVLGWAVAHPFKDCGEYVLAEVRGEAAAGIGPNDDRVPAAWTVYLATDDVAGTAAAAVKRGGTMLLPPVNVGPLGRMSILTDPLGADFGFWQAGTMIGSSFVNEPGGLCWEELRSPNPAASRAFYGSLFDYAFDEEPEDGVDYTAFRRSDEDVPLGAVRAPEDADALTGHWIPFFGVTDAGDATDLAVAHGGTVVLPPFDTRHGRMAALTDPDGAQFWVLTSTGEQQPDRSG